MESDHSGKHFKVPFGQDTGTEKRKGDQLVPHEADQSAEILCLAYHKKKKKKKQQYIQYQPDVSHTNPDFQP